MLEGCIGWPEALARRYRREGWWEDATLFDTLARVARATPDEVAIVDERRRLGYAELVARSEALARGFAALGLRPADRVVFQLANGIALVESLYALLRIGVIPVMALPAHRASEITHFARASRACAYLAPDVVRGFDYRELARGLAADCPAVRHVIIDGEPACGQVALSALSRWHGAAAVDLEALRPHPDDVALMLLSGGTTGMSKLIPRTHNDYVCASRESGRIARLDRESVFLATLPIAHNYSLGAPGVVGTLAVGGRVVIASATSAESVFPLIEAERVSVVAAAVPLATRWLASELIDRHDLSSLRVFMSGGAKLAPEVRRRIEQRFGCTYQESYGTGEGLLNMTRLDDPEAIRMESSGRPVCAADEIRVVDDEGNDVAPGAVGELACRGPYTICGYYDAPAANASAFTRDGFYRMGDIVRLRDGYLYLEGRKKELINRGGEKVSCEEIENLILADARIESVCVVGMPDEVFGEKACAFVILKRGCSLALPDLLAQLETRGIARFKMPERLEVVDEFPLSPAGKVLRRELKARLAASGRAR